MASTTATSGTRAAGTRVSAGRARRRGDPSSDNSKASDGGSDQRGVASAAGKPKPKPKPKAKAKARLQPKPKAPSAAPAPAPAAAPASASAGDGSAAARPYLYAILRKGNNPEPVCRALDRRPHWRVLDDSLTGRRAPGAAVPGANAVAAVPAAAAGSGRYGQSTLIWPANLVWRYLIHPIPEPPRACGWVRYAKDVHRRQATNRLWELVQPLTTKNRLLDCMLALYQQRGEDPWRAVPLTLIVATKVGKQPREWGGWGSFVEAFNKAEAAAGASSGGGSNAGRTGTTGTAAGAKKGRVARSTATTKADNGGSGTATGGEEGDDSKAGGAEGKREGNRGSNCEGEGKGAGDDDSSDADERKSQGTVAGKAHASASSRASGGATSDREAGKPQPKPTPAGSKAAKRTGSAGGAAVSGARAAVSSRPKPRVGGRGQRSSGRGRGAAAGRADSVRRMGGTAAASGTSSGGGSSGAAAAPAAAAEADPAPALGSNLWLVKPTSSNRGRGIEIVDSVEEVRRVIAPARSRRAWQTSDVHEWVVQKYIKNPMLWHGRKFDVRVWVLWTDQYGGQVHMYTNGYVRTSSDEFSLTERGKWVHLTNYCLQKHSTSFGNHEAGNTVSFQQLDAYLRDMPVSPERKASMERATAGSGESPSTGEGKAADTQWCLPMRHIVAQMERVIAETGAAAQLRAAAKASEGTGAHSRLPLKQRMAAFQAQGARGADGDAKADTGSAAPATGTGGSSRGLSTGASVPLRKRQHGFELLGYDFMVDDQFNVWFLEANTNPAVMYQNAWHEALVDGMIEDIFRVAIDPIFPAPAPAGDTTASASASAAAAPSASDSSAPGEGHGVDARPRFKLLYSFGQPRERLSPADAEATAAPDAMTPVHAGARAAAV